MLNSYLVQALGGQLCNINDELFLFCSLTEKQSPNTWWVFNTSNFNEHHFFLLVRAAWITLFFCVCSSGKSGGPECSALQ